MYNNWLDCAAHPDDGESHHLELHAKFVRDLACYAITNRKEIAEGIIRIWISNDLDRRDYSSRLARGLLDGECAATKDFSNQTKERLREFASK
jgi:hypothetical protein